MGGPVAVDAQECDAKALRFLGLALKTVEFLKVGSVRSCAKGAGWWSGASELVMAKAEAGGALGACIKA